MNNIIRAGAAAACGALLGGLLSLDWLPHGWWPLGTTAGGIIGWILYDLVGFFAGLKHVVKAAGESFMPSLEAQEQIWEFLVFMTIGSTACAWFFSLQAWPTSFAQLMSWFFAGFVVGGLLFMVVGILVLMIMNLNGGRSSPKGMRENITYCQGFILRYNAIAAPFSLAIFCFNHILPFLWKEVVVPIFAFTVSDGRIAAFMGASIGATIGYFFGSAVVGAVIGCLASMGLVYMYKQKDDAAAEHTGTTDF